MTDVRTAGRKDFCTVDRTHYLPAARPHAVVDKQSIEADSLVAQRIALVDADHGRRESLDIFSSSKSRPGERVARAKRLDTIRHRATIVMKVHQDAVIFD